MHLTKAEEQVMQILWDMNEGLVKDIRDSFNEPKPARNTVSTVLRVLEKKGYVGHKAYANVHLYHPLVSKSDYSKSQLFGLMEGYFGNSFPAMASFFAREKDLSLKELDELLEDTRKELSRNDVLALILKQGTGVFRAIRKSEIISFHKTMIHELVHIRQKHWFDSSITHRKKSANSYIITESAFFIRHSRI